MKILLLLLLNRSLRSQIKYTSIRVNNQILLTAYVYSVLARAPQTKINNLQTIYNKLLRISLKGIWCIMKH